jgi:hypothetical protein
MKERTSQGYTKDVVQMAHKGQLMLMYFPLDQRTVDSAVFFPFKVDYLITQSRQKKLFLRYKMSTE